MINILILQSSINLITNTDFHAKLLSLNRKITLNKSKTLTC